jgi:hypothetical protein
VNIVFIVPTGIGAEIGGHSGDANAVAKLFASVSDNFITHPNVVNAADINEMTENTLYVEGSILDGFLEGKIGLKKPKSNKVLVVTNSPVPTELINSVSAAKVTIGLDAEIVELKKPLKMIATMENNKASGKVTGWKSLVRQVKKYNFDALAIASPIELDKTVKLEYFNNKLNTNPWGGVEAIASRLIATALNKPVAHAPTGEKGFNEFNIIVDPRKSAEMVSVSYIHCVLKGLHKAPRLDYTGLMVDDIDVLITPANCVGKPHRACMKANIPIIAVKENKTVLKDRMPKSFIVVDNYLEAVGVVQAIKYGISLESIRRPVSKTKLYKGN